MFRRTWATLAVCGAFLGGAAFAQEKDAKKPAADEKNGSKGAKKDKEGGWALVQLGEELMVVKDSQIADLQKEVLKENKAKEKAAKKAKKGEKAEAQKSFKILKRNLATKEDAEKEREKVEKEKEKKDKDKDKDKDKEKEKSGKDKKK
jgi:hypothetical protein